MALKTIYAGVFKPTVGNPAEPDFSRPLHERPDLVTIDRISPTSFSLTGQRIVIKMKEAAEFGYVFCLYNKNGQNLYGEYKTEPKLRQGAYFISTFTSGLFTK